MEIEDRILVITDSISITAAVVFWVFKNFTVQLHNLSIITQASLIDDSLCFEAGSVSGVVSISAKAGFHTQLWLKELSKLLMPNGFLLVQEPSYINHNKQLMLGDSRASLERNLLFAGFSSIEAFPILYHYDEICFHSQHFDLISMKAKKAPVTEAVLNISKPKSLPTVEITSSGCNDEQQKQTEEPENPSKESSKPRKRRPPTDKNVDLKERIRERNRLYQRRRRARMTEEEKNREKERRRLYMQKRRIQQFSGSEDDPQHVD